MDAQLQDAYLSAMGVTQWYPRYTLPHAPELEWPEAPSVSQSPALNAEPAAHLPSAVDSATSLSRLKSLMDSEAEKDNAISSKEKASAPEGAVAATPDHQEERLDTAESATESASNVIVPPLGFLFFRYSLGVSVVVSTPSNEPLSSMEMRFISAILSFLGIPDAIEFSHRVTWPIVENNPQFSTQTFFSESMSALFSKQGVACGVNTYLLFGQRLSSELSPVLNTLSFEGEDLKVIPAPELPELLTSASAKKALWRSLLPLLNKV